MPPSPEEARRLLCALGDRMRDLVVAVLNATGGVLTSENTAVCSLSITASAYAVAAASNAQLLLWPVSAVPVAGVVTFSGVSLVSPLGASATLQVACSRKEGGFVQPVSALVLLDTVGVAGVAGNSTVPAGGLVLYNTAYTMPELLYSDWVPAPSEVQPLISYVAKITQ